MSDTSSDRCPPLTERSLTGSVLRSFFRVYNKLGAGFLESVYRRALEHDLRRCGIRLQCEAPVDVFYDGVCVGHFRADLLVEGRLILELKASRVLVEDDYAQLRNYLEATRLPLGLLLHFGRRPSFRRVVRLRYSGPRSPEDLHSSVNEKEPEKSEKSQKTRVRELGGED